MVSELMAIGAPTRPYWLFSSSEFNPLVIAFGIGVWGSAGRKWTLRVTGVLLIAYGIVGEVALLFAPCHLRGAQASATDTWHKTLTGVIVLLTVLLIGFGAAALGKGFRLYSIVTILASWCLASWPVCRLPGRSGIAVLVRTHGAGEHLRLLAMVLVLAIVLLRSKRESQ
jgi:hypothetical protein